MLYALIFALVLNALTLAYFLRSQEKIRHAAVEREDQIRREARGREDELLNRIQAPDVAVAQSQPESEEPVYISPFDDHGLVDYETTNSRLAARIMAERDQ